MFNVEPLLGLQKYKHLISAFTIYNNFCGVKVSIYVDSRWKEHYVFFTKLPSFLTASYTGEYWPIVKDF